MNHPHSRHVGLQLVVVACLATTSPLLAQDKPSTPPVAEPSEDTPKPPEKPAFDMKKARALQGRLKEIFADEKPDYWSDLGKLDPELKGRKLLKEGLREMDEAGTSGRFLIHAEEYLTSMPPAPDFGRVLWQFLNHVEWAERKLGEDGIFLQLAKVSEGLPQEDEAYFECRFTTAAFHQNRGESGKALGILESLAKNEKLPASYQPTLHLRNGLALEGVGKRKEALQAYGKNSDLDSPAAIASALRRVFHHLAEGEREPASKLLDRLAKIDQKALEDAPGGVQAQAMIHLRKEGSLGAMWDAQKRWREGFEKIFELLSPEPPEFPGGEALPVIANIQDFSNRLDRLADEPDAEGFASALWLAAEAARWDPGSLNNLARALLFDATEIVPERATTLREFVIELCDDFRFGQPEDKNSTSLYHCLALLQLGRDEEALTIAVRDTRSGKPVPEDAAGQALLRLWATAVRRTDGDVLAPGRALENLLESPLLVHERLSTVDALVRLYQHVGEPDAEEALLAREVRKPVYKSDAESLRGIIGRFKASSEAGQLSRQLARAAASWMREEAPAWLRYSRPFTIEDLDAKEVAELVESPSPPYTYLEGAKLRFLAARDSSLPAEERSLAFQTAIETVTNIGNDFGLLQETYARLAKNEAFPESQRRGFAWLALANAAYSDHKPTIRELLNSPLLEDPNEALEDAMRAIEALLGCNRMDVKSIQETIAKLTEGTVGNFDLLAVDTLLGRLLALGALEESRAVLAGIRGWDMAPEIAQGRVQMGIEILGKISGHEGRADRNVALGKIALRLFPDIGKERPKFFHRVGVGSPPPIWLTDDEAAEFLVHQIRAGLHHNWEYDSWIEVCDQIPHPTPPENLDLKFEVVTALLESLKKDDEKRSDVINELGSLFDIDSPEERKRVLELIRPLAGKPSTTPASNFAVALYEVSARLRDGEVVDLPIEFEKLNHPAKRFFELRYGLEQAIKLKDKENLEEIIASMDEEELANDSLLTYLHMARTLLGDEPGTEFTENLRRERDSYLVLAAALGEPAAVYRVVEATRILGDIHELPEGWYEQFSEHCKRSRQLAMTGSYVAELRGEWEKLEKLSSEGIARYPTYYDFYRFHGVAKAERGEPEAAIGSLEVYCKYSRNELAYPAAQALLDKLKAEVSKGKEAEKKNKKKEKEEPTAEE